ncbi:MAG: DUF5063 domain-containing protein [Pyrinomonadaceae bacterium]|nr:DUF5063 domain-containing protein [Pyrinomonadaceae bacterium]MBP6213700.1 DUF5063 domain-containing protein [Pyrinomonadaceae bacterium]
MDEQDIQKFVEIAKQFCTWIEGSPDDAELEIAAIQRLLADLHAAVVRLEDLECGDVMEDEVSTEYWKLVRERFINLPFDGYWDIFDPLDLEPEPPVFNLLSDDLADIYGDVKEGLLLYEKGFVVEAVWQWRFTFSTHWGHHLTGAQRAVHCYLSNY